MYSNLSAIVLLSLEIPGLFKCVCVCVCVRECACLEFLIGCDDNQGRWGYVTSGDITLVPKVLVHQVECPNF